MFNNQQKVLRIHPKDNVLVALINLKNGDTIDFENKSYVLNHVLFFQYKGTLHFLQKGHLDP